MQGLSWEWIFWINVPLGLVAVPLVLTRVSESFGSEIALDIPGLILVSGAAFGIVWALVRGNDAGWGSLEIVASFVVGALLLVAFVAWESRARRADAPAAVLPLTRVLGG